MLEGIVSTILATYLGDYVKGLERENLQIRIAGGEVALNNLELKKEALADLDLPIVLKAGLLGKLHMSIPWSNLGSKPAIIRLKNLFLVAGPAHASEIYDPEEAEAKAQNTKQKKLLLSELLSSKDDGQEQATPQQKKDDDGFTKRLITKVVDNLQIFIDKVHIRYEDDRTNPTRPFVFGITLESLHAQSTDSNWNPTFLQTNEQLVHKLVSLKNFAVYWNSNAPFINYDNETDLSKQLDALTFQDSKPAPHHHYILKPISSTLRAVLNKSDLPDMKVPKFALEFMFDQIALVLEQNQYQDLMEMLESFSRYSRGANYRQFRPTVAPSNDPKAWWKFAVDSILQDVREERKRWNVTHIKQAMQDRRTYVQLYKNKLKLEAFKKTLGTEEQGILAELERKLSYEQIVLFRSLAKAFWKKDQALLEQQGKATKAKGGGWLSSWWGGGPQLQESGLELTDELWKDLYKIVEQEDVKKKSPTEIPKEYIKTKIGFRLDTGSLTLRGSHLVQVEGGYVEKKVGDELDIVQALFKEFDLALKMREDSMSFGGKLRSADVHDFYTDGTRFPRIIFPVFQQDEDSENSGKQKEGKGASSNKEHFLQLAFDMKPVDDPNVDFRLGLDMKPLNVVLNMSLVDKIVQFFQTRDTKALQNLQLQAVRQWEEMRQTTMNRFRWALDKKKVMDINVNVAAPNILVPQSFTAESCPMLVLDLGHLSVQSQLQGNEKERNKKLAKREKGDSSEDIGIKEEDFYDRFLLNLTSLQALLTQSDSNWGSNRKALTDKTLKRMQIIPSFDVNLCLQLCALNSDAFTKLKISGSLPSLQLVISSRQCREFFAILKSVLDAMSQRDNDKESAEQQGLASSTSATAVDAKTKAKREAIEASRRRTALLGTPASQQELEERKLKLQSLLEKKVLELFFVIPEITVRVSKERQLALFYSPPTTSFLAEGETEDGEDEVEFVVLSLKDISVTFVKRSFDMIAMVVMERLEIQDKMQPWGKDFQYLLASNQEDSSSDPVLHLDYLNTSRESPEYDGVDQVIELRLGDLGVMFNRETVVALMLFVNANILDQLKSAEESAEKLKQMQPAEASVQQNALETPEGRALLETSGGNELDNDEPQAAGGAIKVGIHLGQVKLGLNKKGFCMAEFFLRSSRMHMDIRANKTMRMEGKLGSLRVMDYNTPNTLYEEIISIQGKKMVSFSLETYNADDITTPYPGHDLAIQMKMNSIQMTLIQKFFYELILYGTEIKEMQTLMSSTAQAAAESAKQAAQNLSETKKLFHFDISIHNPHVVIPKRCDSDEVIVLNLGNISLLNKYEAVESAGTKFTESVEEAELTETDRLLLPEFAGDEDNTVFEKITLQIQELHLKSGHRPKEGMPAGGSVDDISEDGRVYSKIVKDIDLDVSLERPLKNPLHEFVDQKLTIAIQKINIAIMEEQTYAVFRIVEDNLEELYGKDGILQLLKSGNANSDQDADDQDDFTITTVLQDTEVGVYEVWNTLQVVVMLDALEVEVLEGNGFTPLKSDANSISKQGAIGEETEGKDEVAARLVSSSLASVFANELIVEFTQKSDSSMVCDVQLQSVTLNDTRVQTQNRFRQILSTHSNIDDDTASPSAPSSSASASEVAAPPLKEISVHYFKKAAKRIAEAGEDGWTAGEEVEHASQQIEITVDRPRIFAVPEPLFALKDWGIRMSNALQKVLERMNPSSEDDSNKASTSSSKEDDKAENKSGTSSLDMKVVVTNPEICLLEDSDQLDTRGFVVRSKFQLNFAQSQAIFKNEHQMDEAMQEVRLVTRKLELCKCRFKPEAKNLGQPRGGSLKAEKEKEKVIAVVNEKATEFEESKSATLQRFQIVRFCTEEEVSILEPLDMQVIYKQAKFPVDRCDIVIEIQQMQIIISIKDYKLAFAILDKWLKFLAPPQQQLAIEAGTDGTTSPYGAGEAVTGAADSGDEKGKEVVQEEVDNSSGTSIVPAGKTNEDTIRQRQQPLKPKQHQKLQLHSGGVVVNLINDFMGQNTPLVEVNLAQSAVDVSDWSSLLQAWVDTQIHVNYFNGKLEVWEPVLETWQFQLKYSKHGTGQTISLRGKDVAQVNITRAFVDIVMQTLEILDDTSFYDTSSVQRVQYHPYYIKNDTGQTMWYWLSNNKKDIHVLEQGMEEPVPITYPHKKIRRNLSKKDRRAGATLSVQIEGEFVPIHNISMDSMGLHVLDIAPQSKHIKALYEVSYRRGSKLLHFRSNIKVSNDTNHPIEVFVELNPESEGALTASAPTNNRRDNASSLVSAASSLYGAAVTNNAPILVAPHSSTSLPLAFASMGTIRMRPKGLSNTWTKQALQATHLSKKTGVMTCDPKTAIDKPFVYLVSIDREEEDELKKATETNGKDEASSSSDAQDKGALGRWTSVRNLVGPASPDEKHRKHYHTIEVHPPFRFQNLLASSMELKVVDGQAPASQRDDDRNCFFRCRLMTGEKVDFHQFDINKTLLMSVRINGFNWSAYFPIKWDVPDKVELLDPDKRTLRFNILNKVNMETGINHLRFWCDYWLINKTGLRLLYRQFTSSSATRKVAAGQYAEFDYNSRDYSSVTSKDIENTHNSSTRNSPIWDLKGEPREWFFEDWSSENLKPFMYSFNHFDIVGQKLQLKLANSQWSQGIPLSAQSFVGTVSLSDGAKSNSKTATVREFSLGLSINPGPDKFWRTKIVEFCHHRVLVNKLDETLFYNQVGTNDVFSLFPGECLPFAWVDKDKKEKHLKITLEDSAYYWSGSFSVSELGQSCIKLNKKSATSPSGESSQSFLVRMEVKLENATMFVIFKNESEKYPMYRIENRADETLFVQQKEAENYYMYKTQGPRYMKIPPHTSVPFAWDEPTVPPELRKVVFKVEGTNVVREASLDEFSKFNIRIGKSKYREVREIWVEVLASGPTKVLRITDLNTHKHRYEDTDIFGASSKQGQVVGLLQDEVVELELHCSLGGIGISVIDDTPQELIHASLGHLNMDVILSNLHQKFELTVSTVQIDNQLYNARYPVLLYPIFKERKGTGGSGSSTSGQEENKTNVNFIHCSVVKVITNEDVDYFKYIGFAMQEMDVQVESELLLKLLDFIEVVRQSSYVKGQESEDELIKEIKDDQIKTSDLSNQRKSTGEELMKVRANKALEKQKLEPSNRNSVAAEKALSEFNGYELTSQFAPSKSSLESKMLYVGLFHLNPIACTLSFLSTSGVQSDSPLNKVLSFSGGALTTIENAPIHLNALLLEYVFSTREDFIVRLKGHYTAQAIQQVYSILGSFDFLGSPVSLVNNLGTGVHDFFYEPAQGLVKSPQDFGMGLAKGTTSLIKNTVHGLFNTASKFSGSIGKGAATLSFDADYLKEREISQREKPKHAVEGLAYGVRDFGLGLWKGATGVVVQPIKGAEKQGFEGFVKGVGRGVVGVAAKPIAGTFDLLSQTTDGIRNTAVYFDRTQRERIRSPRYIGKDKVLRPYNPEKSEGKTLLMKLDDERFRKEEYETHVMGEGKGPALNILLISDKHVLYLDHDNPKKILWFFPINHFKKCEITKYGVQIYLTQASSSSFLEYATTVGAGSDVRMVYCNSTAHAEYVQEKLLHMQEKAEERRSLARSLKTASWILPNTSSSSSSASRMPSSSRGL